ncbi:MAG: S8 family serine peptidase, partial [Candidatus Eremiobacteraeota bacterium]|nr:S8 family serine peptidase [Candidatus Eremiobacteraeota bacterium]
MKVQNYVPGEVLVKFRQTPQPNANSGFLKEEGATLLKTFDFGERLRDEFEGELSHVKLPPGLSVEEAMKRWAVDERVEYVASNDYVRGFDASEKLNPRSWGLHNTGQTGGTPDADVDAPEAWAQQSGRGAHNDGPVIAVVDTGIDIYHEALEPNLWTNPGEIPGDGIDNDGNGVIDDIHGYNARQENGFPLDENGHGSHCAGIIGAADGNSQHISGVMKRTQIAGVQFLSKLGMGSLADAIEGLAYADRIGARIVSNSWGGGPYNRALKDVLEASPALQVFAAGNESNDNDRNPTYPASYNLPNVISVAATDHNDRLADFSNYGAQSVDLAAPGVAIYSSVHGGQYKELSGTSMAAPFVTGAAGLIVSEYPQIDNARLKARLTNSVDRLENLEGKVKSGGRLNVARALERDDIAPAEVSDFKATLTAPGRVSLSFSPTGDDGMDGQASLYRVRVSDNPELKDAATLVEGRPDGSDKIQLDLKSPRWGEEKTLYYSVEMEDNVGNTGRPAINSIALPASKMLFEPGNAEDRETWKSRWGFAQVEEAGRG